MTEKSKNDQPHQHAYHKTAIYGCGFGLLIVFASMGLLVLTAIEFTRNPGLGFGPGSSDYCMSTEGVDYDFKLSGRVVDIQSQPIHQAEVKIGSEKPASCTAEVSAYRTTTNENGEFSFSPLLFGYGDEFFISVSIEGCAPSTLYDDQPDNEPVTIILDCTPQATQEAE